jgi:hypothetical protein
METLYVFTVIETQGQIQFVSAPTYFSVDLIDNSAGRGGPLYPLGFLNAARKEFKRNVSASRGAIVDAGGANPQRVIQSTGVRMAAITNIAASMNA